MTAGALAIADHTARAAHYARVDTVVTLARTDFLVEEVPDVVTEVLEVLGIRPPDGYVEQLRHRYPRLYAEAHEAGDAQLRRMNAAALLPYAEDLLELADRIGRYTLDPAGAYEDEHDHPASNLAAAGNDVLDTLRDDYDQLIGASYDTSHRPG